MTFLPRRISLTLAAIAAIGTPLLTVAPASAASLGKPGGLAPNSSTAEYKDPVLSWNNVAGASSYLVQVSRSNDFSDTTDLVPLPGNGVTTVASLALPQTLVHANYWWRVQAISPSGRSLWSSPAQVDRAWDDAPSLTGSDPTGDATTTPGSIATYPWRFAWSALPDASSYELEVSTDPTFPQPGETQSGKKPDGIVTVLCLTTATSLTPYENDQKDTPDIGVGPCNFSNFDPGHDPIFWRARGIDDSRSATLKAANEQHDFACFGVPTEELSGQETTTLEALGEPPTKIPGHECSRWSAAKSAPYFTTGTGSAATPGSVSGVTLDCPAGSGGADFACVSTPEISWDAVSGVNDYAVTIADDPAFTNVEHTYVTPFLSLTPRDQLANYTAGKGYYVAVQSCTMDLCGTATVKTFTKQTPAVNGLSASQVQGGVRLTWNDLNARFGATAAGDPAVEAVYYKVQVARASDTTFASPLGALTQLVDASCDTTTTTCYAPQAQNGTGSDQVTIVPTRDGSYIWRVMPVDLSGNVLPAAADTHAFTVDVTRPTLSIVTHSGIAINHDITIKASEPVTGVNANTVRVVLKGTKAPIAGSLRQGATPTLWVFKPAKPLDTGGTYVLNVLPAVADLSGNGAVVSGAGVRTTLLATNRSKGWNYSSSWHRHSASGARSGSFEASAAGGTATINVVGSEFDLYGCKAPNMGTIKVTAGGHTTTVSEHQSFTRCGVLILHKPLPSGEQRVKVTVAHNQGSIDELKVR